MLTSKETPLYSLGKGKFYREDENLQLDVGPFAAALEFAAERNAVVSRKHLSLFYLKALTLIIKETFVQEKCLDNLYSKILSNYLILLASLQCSIDANV